VDLTFPQLYATISPVVMQDRDQRFVVDARVDKVGRRRNQFFFAPYCYGAAASASSLIIWAGRFLLS
jgi:hypothetical protein